MATIMSLPPEMIIVILEKISIKDIENFSSTCKKFRQTSWGNKLWMKKLYQNWPSIRKVCDSMMSEDLKKDFKEEVKTVVKCVKEMCGLISEIPKNNLSETDKKKSILKFLDKTTNEMIFYAVKDELKRIYSQSPWTLGCNLSQRYYSYYILQQLKYYHIKHNILKFRSRHIYHQLLEEMVILLVQWFNIDSNISYSRIETLLDDIEETVLQVLGKEHPSHPVFAMPNEYFNFWRKYYIFYTYWDYEEILKILNTLKRVVFDKSIKNFHILDQLWIKSHVGDEYEFINSRGNKQDIFFLTIYHAVLRRLGIHSIVHFGKFELRIFLKSNREYILLSHINGQLMILEEILNYDDYYYTGDYYLGDRRIFVKLCYNTPFNIFYKSLLQLESSLIDFLKLESNLKVEEELMLQQIWERDQGNVTDLLNWESNMISKDKMIKMSKPERRSAELKFVIGTIVSHKCNDNTRTHLGVIVGWHNYFNKVSSIIFNSDFIKFCKYKNCTDSTCLSHKPYYIIFCDNNEYCYVRQENISICSSIESIHHDEIGRYFSIYKGTYYVPNEMLAKYYPCDVTIIN